MRCDENLNFTQLSSEKANFMDLNKFFKKL